MIKIDTNTKTIDIAALAKGDYISVHQLEVLFGFALLENESLFRLKTLKLKGEIEKQRTIFSRITGNALRLLTDTEAVYYHEQRGTIQFRGAERSYDRALRIDENELDPNTLNHHRQVLEDRSQVLSAMQTVQKQIRITRQRERVTQLQEDPIRIISLKGKHGTQNNDSTTDGNSPAPAS